MRSAKTPAGSSVATIPRMCALSAAAAHMADPVIAQASSGNTNMLIRLPSSLIVWPSQSTVKSWFRRRS